MTRSSSSRIQQLVQRRLERHHGLPRSLRSFRAFSNIGWSARPGTVLEGRRVLPGHALCFSLDGAALPSEPPYENRKPPSPPPVSALQPIFRRPSNKLSRGLSPSMVHALCHREPSSWTSWYFQGRENVGAPLLLAAHAAASRLRCWKYVMLRRGMFCRSSCLFLSTSP